MRYFVTNIISFRRLSLAVASLTFAMPTVGHAAIQTVGNVTAQNVFDPGPPIVPVDPLGYPSPGGAANTGELIIGDVDTGGLTMTQTSLPTALISTSGIIGNEFLVTGRAVFDSFGSDWLIEDSLIIGNEGQGFLDMTLSSKVQVGDITYDPNANPTSVPATDVVTGTGEIIIGALPDGDGQIDMNGPGTRVITADLTVGDEGHGNIMISGRATLFTGDSILGNQLDSYGTVQITDPGSLWKVGFGDEELDLRVGVLGTAIVQMVNQSKTEVSGDVVIGPEGFVNLKTGGRLRVLDASTSTVGITNNGQIRGGGFVDFVGHEFINQGFGLIRNKSINIDTLTENSNPETLIFTGTLLTNNGTIFAEDGEMIFNVPVTNNFELIVKNSFVQFYQGLDNSGGGTVIVGGESTLHGAINPAPLSNFIILNDSIVTINGDLVFTESFLVAASTDGEVAMSIDGNTGPSPAAILSMGIGQSAGSLTVSGNLDLTNARLDLDVANLGSPTLGDMYSLITVGGDIIGEFDNDTVVAEGHKWDVGYTSNSVYLTYAGLSTGLAGDFDGDGDVDGRDFLAWQRNPTIGNLADWQTNFGQTGGSLAANVAAVPEPSTLFLLASGIMSCLVRRK